METKTQGKTGVNDNLNVQSKKETIKLQNMMRNAIVLLGQAAGRLEKTDHYLESLTEAITKCAKSWEVIQDDATLGVGELVAACEKITKLATCRPEVLVEVNGGNIQAVYSNIAISVDVLDWDNYKAADSPEEKAEFEKMDERKKDLQPVY